MNTRRAFALPLVVILTAVLGTVIAYMLARQNTQLLTVQRQIDGYRNHHNSRGMQELIDAYLKSIRDRDPSRFLAPDGRAVDVDLPGGGLLTIYMADGQGEPLDPAVAGSSSQTAREILAETPEGTPTRTRGSVQVSVNSASRETLIAVATKATDGQHSDDFAGAVLSARAGKPIPSQDLDKIAQSVGFTPEQLKELRKYVTADPQVWLIEARLTPGTGPSYAGTRAERTFKGYATLNSGGSGGMAGINQVWARRSMVHDLKEVRDARPRIGTP